MSSSLPPLAPGWADQPGICRRRHGRHWRYLDPAGAPITDADEIARLNRIALPPAYREAWFSPDPEARILATGVDARGRRQYRYHPDFRAAREAEKFAGCAGFGHALPAIRARVEKDLARRGLSRERALASLVRLLDVTHMRVGNEAYARANKSFGASTLRRRHVRMARDGVALSFRAKSGKMCRMTVGDRGLVRFVKAMEHLPGQHLFQWLDDAGNAHPVGSREVNDYLRAACGADVTAKHFRTFAASVLALAWLRAAPGGGLKAMLLHVSAELHNTPAVARKSYIHPALVEIAAGRGTLDLPRVPRATRWLSRDERAFIAFAEQVGDCAG